VLWSGKDAASFEKVSDIAAGSVPKAAFFFMVFLHLKEGFFKFYVTFVRLYLLICYKIIIFGK